MEGIRKWTTGYLSKHWVTPAGEASAAAFLGCGCLQPGFFFFLLPLWGSPTRLSAAQPFHDWTKWGNTKVYYVARSSRPLLRRTESSKYFYGSKTWLGGKRNLRKRELGKLEKGSVWRCGRDEKVSSHHPGWYHFKELHRSLWFPPSLFYKSGEKILSNCSAEPANAELSFLTFFFLGIQLSDFNL